MKKRFKTTAKDFVLFRKEAKKWLEWWNLLDFDVCFQHVQDISGSLASCSSNILACTATLFLAPDWKDNPVSNSRIKRSAFHEVSELRLARLCVLAESRFINRYEIEEETHALIRVFENRIFGESPDIF